MVLAFASCGGSDSDSKASGTRLDSGSDFVKLLSLIQKENEEIDKIESRLKSSESMDDAVKFNNQWEARKTEADANIAAFMEKKGGSVDIPFEQEQFTDQFKLTSLKVIEANRKNIIMKSVIG